MSKPSIASCYVKETQRRYPMGEHLWSWKHLLKGQSPLQKSRLAKKLFRTIFGTYFIIAFITTALQIASEVRHEENTIKNEISHIVKVFDATLSAALWNLDTDAAETAVNGLYGIDSITGVKLERDVKISLGIVDSNVDDKEQLKGEKTKKPFKTYAYTFSIGL